MLPTTTVTAWEPPVEGIREVFHAQNLAHSYPTHVHDTWTVFIVDDGEINYRLDRRERSAASSTVSVLPPGIPHDGSPVGESGLNKRVLYLEPTLLPERLTGNAVDAPAIADSTLRSAIATLHHSLLIDDGLKAESLTTLITTRIAAHLSRRPTDPQPPASRLAWSFRSLLDEHISGQLTLATAGAVLNANPTHLARAFTNSFGITPHQYTLARRLDAARMRILAGQPLASVAYETGYVDQAHMTRMFKKHTGLTPGQLASSWK